MNMMQFTKLKSIGTKRTASAGGFLRSKAAVNPKPLPSYPFYALCVDNGDGEYEIMLHLGKPYKVIKPRKNDLDSYFRVIDEEGEDYLYPKAWFVPIGLEPRQKRRVAEALASAT
jgi:hypothetical protein